LPYFFSLRHPQQARAWGGDGHRTVAAIAIKLLPPAKAAALDRLLRRSDIREGFIDAASYPDEFASTIISGNSRHGIT
jgi:S1/P1 Nuclease